MHNYFFKSYDSSDRKTLHNGLDFVKESNGSAGKYLSIIKSHSLVVVASAASMHNDYEVYI